MKKWRSRTEVAFRSLFFSILSPTNWKNGCKIQQNAIDFFGLRHVMPKRPQPWKHQYSSGKNIIFEVPRFFCFQRKNLHKDIKRRRRIAKHRFWIWDRILAWFSWLLTSIWEPKSLKITSGTLKNRSRFFSCFFLWFFHVLASIWGATWAPFAPRWPLKWSPGPRIAGSFSDPGAIRAPRVVRGLLPGGKCLHFQQKYHNLHQMFTLFPSIFT